MKTRMIGNLEVSAVGMGCMAFSHGYGKIPAEQYSIEAIPGSKNKERIIENLDAATVELTDEEFASPEAALDELPVYGHRGLSR